MEINKIYQGDCLKVLKTFPDNSVDLTVTSPPYNANLRLSNGIFNKINDKTDQRSKYGVFEDSLQPKEYFEWQRDILKELLRVTKLQIFYNIQLLSPNKWAIFSLFGEFADQIKEVIIWDKRNGEPAIQDGVMNSVWEFIIVFDKNDAIKRRFENAKFDRGTFNNIMRIGKNSQNEFVSNSACFPISLPGILIRNFTNEGDIILDPFNGSGTTTLAARNLKRKYIGIEIDPEYVAISEQRLNQQVLNF